MPVGIGNLRKRAQVLLGTEDLGNHESEVRELLVEVAGRYWPALDEVRDARRYRRLRFLGVRPATGESEPLCLFELDEVVDRDLVHFANPGEFQPQTDVLRIRRDELVAAIEGPQAPQNPYAPAVRVGLLDLLRRDLESAEEIQKALDEVLEPTTTGYMRHEESWSIAFVRRGEYGGVELEIGIDPPRGAYSWNLATMEGLRELQSKLGADSIAALPMDGGKTRYIASFRTKA